MTMTSVSVASNCREKRAIFEAKHQQLSADSEVAVCYVAMEMESNGIQSTSSLGGEQVPVRNGDGMLLLDKDGNDIYEQAGWRVLHDQAGMVLWDGEGQLCWEQVDEELLVLKTRSVPDQVPENLAEQNQRLQTELQRSQLMHQLDVEHVERLYAQQEAQNQTDQRAMMAEFKKKQKEFTDE